MTERPATRKPRANAAKEAEAERQRQEALRAEKAARGTTAPEAPVDGEFKPEPQATPEIIDAINGSKAEAAPEAEAPAPPPKKRAPRKPKPEAEPATSTDAQDTADADKAALAAPYANLTAESPASERHAAVKALAATGMFSYVEIAKLTHYANGGVVRNIVIPPVRKGRSPLQRYAGNLDGMAEFLRGRGLTGLAETAEALAKEIAALGE